MNTDLGPPLLRFLAWIGSGAVPSMGILIYGPAKSYSTLTSFHRRRPPRRWPRVPAPVNPSLRVISATLNAPTIVESVFLYLSILVSKNFLASISRDAWLIGHACNAVNTSVFLTTKKNGFSIIFSLQQISILIRKNFTRQFHDRWTATAEYPWWIFWKMFSFRWFNDTWKSDKVNKRRVRNLVFIKWKKLGWIESNLQGGGKEAVIQFHRRNEVREDNILYFSTIFSRRENYSGGSRNGYYTIRGNGYANRRKKNASAFYVRWGNVVVRRRVFKAASKIYRISRSLRRVVVANQTTPPSPPIPGPRCNDKYKASPPSRGWIVAKPLNVLSLDTRNFQWIFHLAFLSSIRLCPLFGYVNGNRRANLILHDCWLSSLSINCDTFMGEDCSSRSIKFGDWANFPSKDEIKLNKKVLFILEFYVNQHEKMIIFYFFSSYILLNFEHLTLNKKEKAICINLKLKIIYLFGVLYTSFEILYYIVRILGKFSESRLTTHSTRSKITSTIIIFQIHGSKNTQPKGVVSESTTIR